MRGWKELEFGAVGIEEPHSRATVEKTSEFSRTLASVNDNPRNDKLTYVREAGYLTRSKRWLHMDLLEGRGEFKLHGAYLHHGSRGERAGRVLCTWVAYCAGSAGPAIMIVLPRNRHSRNKPFPSLSYTVHGEDKCDTSRLVLPAQIY